MFCIWKKNKKREMVTLLVNQLSTLESRKGKVGSFNQDVVLAQCLLLTLRHCRSLLLSLSLLHFSPNNCQKKQQEMNALYHIFG